MRKSLKQRQDQEKVAQCRDEIAKLEARTAAGEIELYYFDESGVSTVPEVPYGWQNVGETVLLPAFRTPRLNILGFFSQSQPFYSETVDGRVNSDTVIACFDNFANSRQMPTVVLIDNASIHTSKKFKARLPLWEAQGLSLYYLPPYSPELNLIEIVWRFLKYKWLPLSAYQNRPTLRASLLEILAGIGSEYTISFA